MNEKSIYSEIILSKTGLEIPLLCNGKSIDSRYDPLRDSLRLIEEVNENASFIIVLGIASGIFIQSLLEKRKDLFVLAVEKSQADLEFLGQLQTVKKFADEKRVCLCSLDQLENKIIELYVPAFYGDLQVIEQRAWTNENTDCLERIKASINKAAGIVSADFSVQSHFGKLWQHNIMSNLKSLDYANNDSGLCRLPLDKTAVIVAAGPSLDITIKNILSNRDDYYVIATDTALSVLLSYKITPRALVSIDGQNVSNVHFIHNENADISHTLFLFDLCANSSAVNRVIKCGGQVFFFSSGHPLCEYVNRHYSLGLPGLFSGAGTVTITALDFAVQAGFKKIITAGADFAYYKGKPYAKGTYLDRLYNQKANRIENINKQFSALEFRTELLAKNEGFTTQILQAYQMSFENYLTDRGLSFTNENNLYIINSPGADKISFTKNQSVKKGDLIISDLMQTYRTKDYDRIFNSIYELKDSDISLLPLISWIRNHDNIDKKNFNYYYKKAIDCSLDREEINK